MINSIIRFVKLVRSKPIWYWFGKAGPIEYKLLEGKILQILPTGASRVVIDLDQMEYWSDDTRLKTVTIGLKNGNVLIIGDRYRKLSSLLAEISTTCRKRD